MDIKGVVKGLVCGNEGDVEDSGPARNGGRIRPATALAMRVMSSWERPAGDNTAADTAGGPFNEEVALEAGTSSSISEKTLPEKTLDRSDPLHCH